MTIKLASSFLAITALTFALPSVANNQFLLSQTNWGNNQSSEPLPNEIKSDDINVNPVNPAVSFSCENSGSTPVTVVKSQGTSYRFLNWYEGMPIETSLEAVCNQVADKLQLHYGKDKSLAAGKIGKKSFVCLKDSQGDKCETEDIILFTLNTPRPGQVLAKMIPSEAQEYVEKPNKPVVRGGDFRLRYPFSWLPF
ncbi:MAG: hypothetical protein D6756_02985 [Cyanobacteria bacterium J083]|nr:MAG: hypothetical protein D6756_02985 [Cyanobacteria bacterium J083]